MIKPWVRLSPRQMQAIALAPAIAAALDQRQPRGSKYQPHQGAREKARRLAVLLEAKDAALITYRIEDARLFRNDFIID